MELKLLLEELKIRELLESKLGGEVQIVASIHKDKESFQVQLTESLSQLQDLREKLVEERSKNSSLSIQSQESIDKLQSQFTQQINDLRLKHSQEISELKLEQKGVIIIKDQDIKTKQKTIDELRGTIRISQNNLNELNEKIRKNEDEILKLSNKTKNLEQNLEIEKQKSSQLLLSGNEEFDKIKQHDQQIIKNLQEQITQANSILINTQNQSKAEIKTIKDQFQAKIDSLERSMIEKSTTDENELNKQLEQHNIVISLEHNLRIVREEYEADKERSIEERNQINKRYQNEINELNLKFKEERKELENEIKELKEINEKNLEKIKKLKLEFDQKILELNAEWEKRILNQQLKSNSSSPSHNNENEENKYKEIIKTLKEKNEKLKNKFKDEQREHEEEIRKLTDDMAKRSITEKDNNKNNQLEEVEELREEITQLEKELQEKEEKYSKLKLDIEIIKRNSSIQIEELKTELQSKNEIESKFAAKEADHQYALQAERKIRDQLQVRLRDFENKLENLQSETDKYYAEEEKNREQRLKELNAIPDSKKNMRSILEEKYNYEAKVKSLERELQNQKNLLNELESAFANKLESLIGTIDSEYEKRDKLEVENRALIIRLDEVEDLLVEETKIRRHLEREFVDLAQKNMELELELLEETKTQMKLKEEVAAKLDGFCNTLDAMYDKQTDLQEEKKKYEIMVEDLEQKLLDEARLRVELNEKLATEAELRSQLEYNFMDKLEKLSLLLVSEREGSTYEDVEA